MGLFSGKPWRTALLSVGLLLSCDSPDQPVLGGGTGTTGTTSGATVEVAPTRDSADTGTSTGTTTGEPTTDASVPDEHEVVCPTEDKVFEGDVTLVTAEDVAALEGYTIIAGDLIILASELVDLEGLDCISEVEGNLVISDNEQLATLLGLGGLGFIGGDLIVTGNTALDGLTGLNPDVHVAGQRVIADNAFDDTPEPDDGEDRGGGAGGPTADVDVGVGGPTVTSMTPVAPGTAINVNTVWDLAGSPYIIGPGAGDLTVSAGVSLTIEAGVEVHMGAGDTGRFIDVYGTLNVQGTAANPVVFRHESQVTANSWEGIRMQNGSSGSISYAQIRHADYALRFYSPVAANYTIDNVTMETFSTAGLYTTGGTLTATNIFSTGTGSSSYCIYKTTNLTLTGGAVSACTYGLYSAGSNATVDGMTFNGDPVNNNDYGIYHTSSSSASLTLSNSTILDFNRGAQINYQRAGVLTNNIFAGTMQYGTYSQNNGSGAMVASHNTFYGQTGAAIRNYTSGSNCLDLHRNIFFSASAIFSTVGYSNGCPTADVRENVWWGGTVPNQQSYSNVYDNLTANALLVDPGNGNFEPTERSPARWWSPMDGTAVAGAIDYIGAPSPPGFHGAWYVDQVFALDTTYQVTGDMLIHPDTTVTVQPGATLEMVVGDDLQGGTDDDLVEIYVAGELEADGTITNFANMTSAAAVPMPGDWTGIVIIDTSPSFNVSETNILYARRGVDLRASAPIVQNAVIEESSEAGIYITGSGVGPTITGTTLNNNYRGIHSANGNLTVSNTTVTNSTQDGIYIQSSGSPNLTDVTIENSGARGYYQGSGTTLTWDGGGVRDSVDDGIYANMTANLSNLIIANNGDEGVEARTQTHTHNTIVSNAGDGIRTTGSYTVTVNSTSITHNVGQARGGSGSLTCNDTNRWGNGSGNDGVIDGAGCFGYNPLYADLAGGDYRPTSRSPNRNRGPDGYIGADEYVGQLTVPLMGFFWEDYTFLGGSHQIPGDIIVPAGATVTLDPGAVLLFQADGDDMGGGEASTRSALRVLVSGTLVTDGMGAPITLAPDTIAPEPGDWQGLRFFDAETSNIDNVRIEYPNTGIRMSGPAGPPVEDTEILYADQYGIYASDVDDPTSDIDFDRMSIIGDGFNTYGIYMTGGCDGMIRSSYLTHTSYGNGYGIRITSSGNDLDIINNTIVRQRYGLYYTSTSASTYDIYNNVIVGSQTYAIYGETNTTQRHISNVFFDTSNRFELPNGANNVGNITVDPLIEDDDWEDFPRWWDGALWAESLAVNAGSPAAPNLPMFDIRGNPRTIGAAPDMGAFEFDPMANQEPRADGIPDAVLQPHNEPVVLDGSAAVDPDGTIDTAYWTIESTGEVIAGQSPGHTFDTNGDGQFAYITIIDNDGAEDHHRVQFDVNMRPVADAGVEVFENVGNPVNFNEASSDGDGTIVSWSWDFGDGIGTSNMQNPQYTYNSVGDFAVTLTVTDDVGLTDVDTTVAHIIGMGADTTGPNVLHTEVADGQIAGNDLAIVADVTDPSGVNSVFVCYRAIGDVSNCSNFAVLTLAAGDTYSGIIPGADITVAGVEYWIVADDTLGNSSITPVGAPAMAVWDFLVVTETDPPSIVHSEIVDGQNAGAPVNVQATISDATGVASAYVYYRELGSAVPFTVLAMSDGGGNVWSTSIPGVDVNQPGIEYYIEASDTNIIPNTGNAPVGAPVILYDFTVAQGMGADMTPPTINHTAIADGQLAGNSVTVTADIIDAGGVAAATIYYRDIGAGGFSTAAMANIGGNTWQGQIPGVDVTVAGVEYYIEAEDTSANAATDPVGAPGMLHAFTVIAVDTDGPTIVHMPIGNGQAPAVAVTVSATVTDVSGLSFVRVYYRTQGGLPIFSFVNAINTSGDTWEANIPSGAVAAPGVDYYIQASDTLGNVSTDPAGAPGMFLSFTVGAVDSDGPSIVHTEVPNGQTENVAVPISANVVDPSGVASVNLYYRITGAPAFTQAAMVEGPADVYSATIPAASVTTAGVDYYIEATDASMGANVSTDPFASWHTFTVLAADMTGPVITHMPITQIDFGDPLVVVATLTDASPIDTAVVRWRLDGGGYSDAPMANIGGNDWQATVPAASILNGTMIVGYYIEASDTLGNTSSLPATAPADDHPVTVIYPDVTPPVVTLDPIAQPHQEGDDLLVTINANDAESGITSVLVYYKPSAAMVYASVPAVGAGPYTAVIPGAEMLAPSMDIYAEAVDGALNVGTSAVEMVTVVPPPDLDPPTILIAAVPDGQLEGVAVVVDASITDASGIASASLFYRLQGGNFSSVPFMNTVGDNWEATIPAMDVQAPVMEYYVLATDASPAGNVGVEPAGGAGAPLSFTVDINDTAGPTISHNPVMGPVLSGSMVTVQATISDGAGVQSASVWWRDQGGGVFSEIVMTNFGGGLWSADIPAVVAPGVDYYIAALDTLGNQSFHPAMAPADWHNVTVIDPDFDAPTINHVEITDGQLEGMPVVVQATVTDVSGVDSVLVYYRTAGAMNFTAAMMPLVGGDLYSGTIPGGAVALPAVEYYIEATDLAFSGANVGTAPMGAPGVLYDFIVGPIDMDPPMIVHNPIADGQDEMVAVTVSADITDATGVSSATLFYRTTGDVAWSNVNMTLIAGNTYEADIDAATVLVPGVDYYIEAIDSTPAMLASTDPPNAPGAGHHSFTVMAMMGSSSSGGSSSSSSGGSSSSSGGSSSSTDGGSSSSTDGGSSSSTDGGSSSGSSSGSTGGSSSSSGGESSSSSGGGESSSSGGSTSGGSTSGGSTSSPDGSTSSPDGTDTGMTDGSGGSGNVDSTGAGTGETDTDGPPPMTVDEGCGSCSTGRSGGGPRALMLLGVMLLLRRRRRGATLA